MKITDAIYENMKECAEATCGNAFLLDNGDIVDRHTFRKLPIDKKLNCAAVYLYQERNILKI